MNLNKISVAEFPKHHGKRKVVKIKLAEDNLQTGKLAEDISRDSFDTTIGGILFHPRSKGPP